MSSLSIGAAGMRLASTRLETSAARVVRFGTGRDEVDLSAEMVNVIQAKADFKASAKIVTAARDMDKALLDILA